ncbi:MAG: 50S ribosomal protein L29 [Prevotellaceae bacterium]|jgi:large subunit ribosomal protein L29|nr:50S ribosomal protein L29 [Prevotellaceae bacterium]
MKINEIRELTDNEIRERELVERDSLIRMRLSHAITQLDNSSQIKETRRTIARLATERRARKLKQQQ